MVHREPATSASVVGSFIRRYRDEIISEWLQRARASRSAKSLSEPLLRDHLPQVLDELATSCGDTDAIDLPGARQHALERLGEGFEIGDLVHELSLLRISALDVWHRHQVAGSSEDLARLHAAIDRAIEVSVACYVDALRSERERVLAQLESIIEHAPAAIWVKDAEGHVVLANHRLAQALGHANEAVLGRRSDELLPLDAATQHQEHDRIVLEENRAIEVEEVVPTAGGQRTFLSIKFPIPGEPPLVGGIATEITERKRMEEELRTAVRAREDMMAVVSHDLRSPLAAVQLSTTLLMPQIGGDPRARRYLDMIQGACLRMESLINDLLDTASIREGRFKIEPRRELIDEVVTQALDLQTPLAEEKRIALVRHCDFQGLRVRCDRERIIQVFANLIGNALKFCRPGDTITINGERVGNDVQLSVSDTGPGIEAERLGRVFEAYWSGPEHRKTGSGLGLYIVRGIVESHGGRIWAESRPGQGATFVFTLPIDR